MADRWELASALADALIEVDSARRHKEMAENARSRALATISQAGLTEEETEQLLRSAETYAQRTIEIATEKRW